LDDDPSTQIAGELIELTLQAAKLAASVDLRELSSRLSAPPYYPEIWPGEHYKFLCALAQLLNPRCVIEIGTGRGLSALAMLQGLGAESLLYTFDTVEWENMKDGVLRESDFADGRLKFSTDDLSDPLLMSVYHSLLSQAELIFIDGPKNRVTETQILKNLETIPFIKPPLVVFDDIRLPNMVALWRSIRYPKFDATSLGHWSGTGLVRLKRAT